MSELKPCPFCGGKPIYSQSKVRDRIMHAVDCDCGASYFGEDWHKWNTRKPHPAIKAVFEKYNDRWFLTANSTSNVIKDIWQAIRKAVQG